MFSHRTSLPLPCELFVQPGVPAWPPVVAEVPRSAPSTKPPTQQQRCAVAGWGRMGMTNEPTQTPTNAANRRRSPPPRLGSAPRREGLALAFLCRASPRPRRAVCNARAAPEQPSRKTAGSQTRPRCPRGCFPSRQEPRGARAPNPWPLLAAKAAAGARALPWGQQQQHCLERAEETSQPSARRQQLFKTRPGPSVRAGLCLCT